VCSAAIHWLWSTTRRPGAYIGLCVRPPAQCALHTHPAHHVWSPFCTGFHEFCEFTAEDVGTVDSGLNSVVLANNNE